MTDKLGSYGAAKKDIMPATEHRSHKGLNNRAENSHLPIRKREKLMQGFRSWRNLQHFVTVFSVVRNCFVPTRHASSAVARHMYRLRAFAGWRSAAGVLA